MHNPPMLPLENLLIRLEQVGIQIDLPTRICVQKALHQLGDTYREEPETLYRLLSPLLARDASQQAQVREIFQAYWQGLQEPIDSSQWEEKPDSSPAIKRKLRRKRVSLYGIGGLAVTLVAVLVWTKLSTPFPAYEGADTQPLAQVREADKAPESEILPGVPVPATGESAPTLLPIGPSRSELWIQPPSSPTFSQESLRFHAITEPDRKVVWLTGNEFQPLVWGEVYEALVPKAGLFTQYALSVSETEVQALSRADHFWEMWEITAPQYRYQSALSVFPGTLSQHEQFSLRLTQLQSKQAWIKFWVVTLYLSLILLIEGYLYYYREKLYAISFTQRFESDQQGDYQLPYVDQQMELQAEPGLYELAQQLRKRQKGLIQQLDVPASLYATVRAGGFPQLAYRNLSRPTEYLVLIDQNGPIDQQADLFQQLVRLLQKEEVLMEVFHFRNDPRICYRKDEPATIELEALALRFPKHRLLIFSKGTFFLDQDRRRLAAWVQPQFEPWEHKALLTPAPPREWESREACLQEAFVLLPADMQAQQGIVDALMGESSADFESLRQSLLTQSKLLPPLSEYDFENPEDLQNYLGEGLYEWLMASMVCPRPTWAMVLQIGEALDEQAPVLADAKKLVRYDHLLKLSNIPWLREVEVPAKLRAQLQSQLDPQLEVLARKAVLHSLEQIPAAPHTPAGKKKQIQQWVQEAALQPKDSLLQRKLSYLWQKGLLDRRQIDALGAHFRPVFAARFLTYAPRVIAISLLSLLPGLLVIGGLMQQRYYTSSAIAERQLDQTPWSAFAANETEEVPAPHTQAQHSFQQGIAYLRDNRPQLAIEAFSHQPSAIGHWFLALAYLANDQGSKAHPLLQKISLDAQHPYRLKAEQVQTELASFWH